ncbi:MAG: diguanylate cyclase domain-containing protein [Pseudorhodoplanes sp.]
MIGVATLSSRASLQDMVIWLASVGAVILFAYEYSFFENADAMTAREKHITTGEFFVVSGIFIVGLIIFAFRRGQQEKRELALRLVAEFAAHQARDEAMHDPLTNMPNRRALSEAMSVALSQSDPAHASHALVMLDLNGFKAVNDRYGHPAGDRLLQEIAARLEAAAGSDKVPARIGGDEFAIFCPSVRQPADVEQFIRSTVGKIEAPIVVDGIAHRVGAGAGIAFYPRDARTEQDLFRRADEALYRAKAEPHSAVRSYS